MEVEHERDAKTQRHALPTFKGLYLVLIVCTVQVFNVISMTVASFSGVRCVFMILQVLYDDFMTIVLLQECFHGSSRFPRVYL